MEAILDNWEGSWEASNLEKEFHEANYLYLESQKAYKYLNWSSRWNFENTINKTINWYKKASINKSFYQNCIEDINNYIKI